MHRLAVVLILGTLASGCSVATRAQAPIERPSLEVPPAPPRVIDPAPAPEIVQIEPVSELPPPPVDPKPMRRSPRDLNNNREAQKPTENKADTPPVTETPAAAPQNIQPAPVLRTQSTTDAAAAERRIRDIIGRAQGMLQNIDYQRLNDQRRIAYDQAKSSIEGAEAALKDLSFELAQQLAEKAEKLAKELQTR
ncbi:MAG: hypothetical protein ACRD1U_13025 [Vicinamibacterales bacterium]